MRSMVLAVVLVLLPVACADSGGRSSNSKGGASSAPAEEAPGGELSSGANNAPEVGDSSEASPAGYRIVRIEDTSHKAMSGRSLSSFTTSELAALPTDRRIGIRAVLEASSISQEQVRPMLKAIIDSLSEARSEVDEMTVWLFSSEEVVDGAYDVGMATWSTGGQLGDITPEIARENIRPGYAISYRVKENVESYLAQRSKSETKAGLSEEKRREIFRALVRAEDRATLEADRRYPINVMCVDAGTATENVEKNAELAGQLTEKYVAQVRERYGISEAVEDSISMEGLTENWSMPEIPERESCS